MPESAKAQTSGRFPAALPGSIPFLEVRSVVKQHGLNLVAAFPSACRLFATLARKWGHKFPPQEVVLSQIVTRDMISVFEVERSTKKMPRSNL